MSTQFINFMMECGVLLFGDFTLKSGKQSSYFINTGEFKTGSQIAKLSEFYAELINESIQDMLQDKKPTVLLGAAYKGIPLVVASTQMLARKGLDFNVSFNCKEQSVSERLIGYKPSNGDRIAIIDDVITAGTSIRELVVLLSNLEINAKIVALYVSVDRMECDASGVTAAQRLQDELGIAVYSITTIKQIAEYINDSSKINYQ